MAGTRDDEAVSGSVEGVRLELKRRGIRTRKGGEFFLQYVRTILTSRRYIGQMWYGGLQWEDDSIVCVKKSTWEAVQEVLAGV